MIPPTLTEAQMHAAEMGRKLPPPERYRWQAIWWHLESKRCRPHGIEAIKYASNMLSLRRFMLEHPDHFARKPKYYRGNEISDWQWMQIALDCDMSR